MRAAFRYVVWMVSCQNSAWISSGVISGSLAKLDSLLTSIIVRGFHIWTAQIRAGAQNEINVGCSICLMVFMVSDGGVGWRRLACGLWRGTSLWKASVLVFCTKFLWNKLQCILCLELWVYCVCRGRLCLVVECSHFVKCCPVVCVTHCDDSCPGNIYVNDSWLCEICRYYCDDCLLGCDTGCRVIM